MASTPLDVTNLNKDLMQNYDPRVRGTMDLNKVTAISIETFLTSIVDFEELSGKFSFVAYFIIQWQDDRLRWNTSEYNGVNNTSFFQSDVWHPLITPSQSSDEFKRFGFDWMQVTFVNNGLANWVPGDLYHSTCRPNVRLYPFDTQVCVVVFMLHGYTNKEIHLRTINSEVNLALYSRHGLWDLQNTRTYVEFKFGTIIEYHIEFTLKRESQFYVVGLILPIATMGILNLLVFLLPPESGERVGFSITVLLALAVFLTIASDSLPKTSKPSIPLICVKLYVDMVISSVIMLFTVVGLRMYHKEDRHPVPSCLATFARCCLCMYDKKDTRKRRYEGGEYTEQSISRNKNGSIIQNGNEKLHVCDIPATLEDIITWKDVAKAFDIVFFLLTFIAFALSHTSMIALIYS
ncbi:hypothetical protein FSP39_007526 [Pinctada imbricata]|uniref:Uncharacterized protein n=1 Tax=Pinctada imbricata TaxID=66713 RepID=A0AA89C119_PINIB|nr:hypothetical protein FSP39_007526 [Pinctada imbricata]